MPEVRVIRRTDFTNRNLGAFADQPSQLRVAAYARVSTEFEEQEDSFERQVQHYTEFINSNPNWKFVKVYSDPGISGTRAEKRPGFQQMIADCKDRKIDKILVKSISRFARNTVDALRYIRELKDLGISIYFETQQIDTLTPGGDVLITILAATAEEESRTISKNIKWAYKKKFEKGDFTIDYTSFYGYTRDKDHNFVIVPEEAKVIRRIYNEYMFGYSIARICKDLNDEGLVTKRGCKWQYSTIKSILTNEKYYGTAIMGKTYKPDVLSKKRVKTDEVYILENAFEGIVTKETFEAVKQEMKRRDSKERSGDKTYGKFSSKYVFSKMIRCGCCGEFYIRNSNMRMNKGHIPSWWCAGHFYKRNDCPQKGISEDAIKRAFVKVLNELIANYSDIKNVLEMSIKSVVMNDPSDKIRQLDDRISSCQTQMLELHKKKTNGEISEDEYNRLGGQLAIKIDDTRKEKESLESSYTQSTLASKRVEDILKVLNDIKPTEEFNEDIFRRLVDSITVKERTHLVFKFRVGLEREVIADMK